ncbi:MAG: NAD(P)H-hydrate dehydratase, partial [Flavobacteriaceae bacterium]|nr:NAD(P)H-hydrate dehydratase [Flavobacteriaceae bacterium]
DALEEFLKKNKSPLVIDADGLNILSKKKSLLKLLPSQSILTPHPKELSRLIGEWKDDFEKIAKTKAFSKKYDALVVIKGANTLTIYKDRIFVNSSGNPGMATAGSGDVLTGMLTGLRSQGYDAISTAVFGVYLHGRAGDIAASELGYEAILASDINNYIGDAIIDLFKQPEPQPQEEQNKEEEKKEQ